MVVFIFVLNDDIKRNSWPRYARVYGKIICLDLSRKIIAADNNKSRAKYDNINNMVVKETGISVLLLLMTN